MQPRVTAILVARNGAKHLERTLKALSLQTRKPDIVITVDAGSTDATAKMLSDFGPTQFIAADADLNFGQAIAAAVRVTTPPTHDRELLWLLAQDSAPDPTALEVLVDALEIAPSVAVAGPKVMEWIAGEYIHNFGESMTPGGATVTLVESELDQGQHDGLSDVLAVSAGGMLVRHTVWEQLGGFDPALPTVDDSLDFCVRVRLAGYRVSVVAAARVASAGDGVAGPNQSSRGRLRRRRVRAERSAQLHRRLVYAPAGALVFHWLSLLPLAFLRSLGQLLRKEPGAIVGEFSAAFGAAFNGRRVGNARRSFAKTRTLGWDAISTLRVPSAEVRRRHSLKREASLFGLHGERPEIRFFSGGGAWTMLGAAVLGVVMMVPLLGADTLTGGGMLPLSPTLTELWASVGYGWRDVGLGFVGAADPFAAVVAVLGSIAFWSPSFALVLLYALAFPLAAVGAWMAATRLSDRGSLRALAATLWVLSPTFLIALADGRPAAILVHLLLPWLFFAWYAAARTWSASASAALLFAAVVACAPSLAPALLVVWLLSVVLAGRRVMRFVGIPLPALALALPLLADRGLRGSWLDLVADPGLPVPSAHAPTLQLLLGLPGSDGWADVLARFGVGGLDPQLFVPILLAPLALLAVLALLLPGARLAGGAWLVALLGLGTALAANQLVLAAIGAEPVRVWSGAGLSLYWLGLVGALVIGLRSLRRFASMPGVVAALALAVVVLPLVASLHLGTAAVREGTGQTQPAFVAAEARIDSRVGTLKLTPQADGGLLASIERGVGATLNQQSTLASTAQTLSANEKALAELTGNLASRSGLDTSTDLAEFGIRFIVLQPAGDSVESGDTALRTETALDGNAALAPVGDTEFGRLWQFGATDASASTPVPANAGGVFGLVTLLIAIAVVGSAVLLSLPIGAGREAVRQANRDAIRRAARANAKQKQKLKPKRARKVKGVTVESDLDPELERPLGTDLEADLAMDRETGVGTGLESDDGFEPTDEVTAEPTFVEDDNAR
ncbi:glycosyltransferase family 2 protein [Cryobacterium sp. PH29-G1]|uniref:glycosyltransferase family 2 protein n=1 Tax=Cryobacterium sp. PH29-G1 TaxID=3046211 RepID=UPI0024BA726F|nr:glycosyltransferase family 2 protein [Cryobacterium sp. PH29-G1]MDJ0351045.1 glycosyltransferase family 2 protein [Cryobacterium sp. PH29-G1]